MTSRRLAWSAWVLTVFLGLLALALIFLNRPHVDFGDRGGVLIGDGSGSLVGVVYAAVGALIVSRHPAHRIGWLFCIIGFVFAFTAFASEYAISGLLVGSRSRPGALLFAWIQNWLIDLAFPLGFSLLLLLFPHGRLPTGRWRVIFWAALAVSGGLVLTDMVTVYSLRSRLNGFLPLHVANPIGLLRLPGQQVVWTALNGVLLAILAISAAGLVWRMRGAAGVERQQLKWLAYVAGLIAAGAVISPLFPPAFLLIIVGSVFGIPIATGIAVFQHRLYDIDVVMSRTFVYGALTLFLVATYVLVVGSLGILFQTSGNLAISLVATGIVALLFQPLRNRLQLAANRLLFGQRDEPYAVVSELSRRLQETLAIDAVLPTLADTIGAALKLPFVEIRLKRDGEFETAAVFGRAVVGAPPLMLQLVDKGETLGEMLLGPRGPAEPWTAAELRLLDELARQAAAAARAVELTANLRSSNAHVVRAREDLVRAREEERRRLRRDLHDGLGPTLAAFTLRVGTIQRLIRRDVGKAEDLLIELSRDLEETIGEIRRLVYQLRPPSLDELGLVEAVRETLGHQAGNVRVSVDAPANLPPIPAATEVAAYRICQEAVTNAVRHSRATVCTVTMRAVEGNGSGGDLMLEIVDNGVGFGANPKWGVGVSSMRERAAELGGKCTLDRSPGGGTRVMARLPMSRVDAGV